MTDTTTIKASAAPSARPAPSDTASGYVPGVCNIGPAEIARRRLGGHVFLAASVGLFAGLLLIDAPAPARLPVALPVAVSTSRRASTSVRGSGRGASTTSVTSGRSRMSRIRRLSQRTVDGRARSGWPARRSGSRSACLRRRSRSEPDLAGRGASTRSSGRAPGPARPRRPVISRAACSRRVAPSRPRSVARCARWQARGR